MAGIEHMIQHAERLDKDVKSARLAAQQASDRAQLLSQELKDGECFGGEGTGGKARTPCA